MPIVNKVDDAQKCVYTLCKGTMSETDFDLYFAKIWTHASYFGYNELFDTTEADWQYIEQEHLLSIAKKASQLTAVDKQSKLAFLIKEQTDREKSDKEQTDYYKSVRAIFGSPARELQAFYNRDEAMNWLNINNNDN